MTMDNDPFNIARQSCLAYAHGDRAALEELIAADFHATSPLDNRIDRQTCFARCRPNHASITGFNFIRPASQEDQGFVTYEGESNSGHRLRNTEVATLRTGMTVEVEVYVGWNVPHEAKPGEFVAPTGR